MSLLKPEMIDDGTAASLRQAMVKDVRSVAQGLRGRPAWFVTVADLPVQDQRVALFVAVKTEAEAKAWLLKFKGKKPEFVASGTCTLNAGDRKDGRSSKDVLRIAIGKVMGDRRAAMKTAALAVRHDHALAVVDGQAERDEDQSEETGR